MADQSNNVTTYFYLKSLWREKFQLGEFDAVAVARAAWKAYVYAQWESQEWRSIHRLDHFYDDLTADWHPDEASRQRAEETLLNEVRIFLGLESEK
jgi:hypothetical protein